jgi:hypothetical protein
MTPLPHLPLPLANSSAFTPARTHAAPQGRHWQLALERALAGGSAASQPGVHVMPREAGAPPGAPMPERANTMPESVSTPRESASTLPQPTSTLPEVASPAMAVPKADSRGFATHAGASFDRATPHGAVTPHEGVAPRVPMTAVTQVEDAAPAAHEAAHAVRTREPTCTERVATRVHLEKHPDGLAVWIGADGDAASIQLQAAALLAELQRALPAAGQRLARLVCNGVDVHIASPLEKETS